MLHRFRTFKVTKNINLTGNIGWFAKTYISVLGNLLFIVVKLAWEGSSTNGATLSIFSVRKIFKNLAVYEVCCMCNF